MTDHLWTTSLAIGLAGASAAPARSPPDKSDWAKALQSVSVARCSSRGESDEILVCGRSGDRYRIPEQLRTEGARSSGGIRPNMPLQPSDLAPCGIFRGERRCSKSEAAQYGYGGGRDPITFVTRIVSKLRNDH